MKYRVLSLDMWGHVPADCCSSYGCSCVTQDGDGKEKHDDDKCDCSEQENNRFSCGMIVVHEQATDEEILHAVHMGGFLSDVGRKVARVDDYSDGSVIDILDDKGRRLFTLEEVDDA